MKTIVQRLLVCVLLILFSATGQAAEQDAETVQVSVRWATWVKCEKNTEGIQVKIGVQIQNPSKQPLVVRAFRVGRSRVWRANEDQTMALVATLRGGEYVREPQKDEQREVAPESSATFTVDDYIYFAQGAIKRDDKVAKIIMSFEVFQEATDRSVSAYWTAPTTLELSRTCASIYDTPKGAAPTP